MSYLYFFSRRKPCASKCKCNPCNQCKNFGFFFFTCILIMIISLYNIMWGNTNTRSVEHRELFHCQIYSTNILTAESLIILLIASRLIRCVQSNKIQQTAIISAKNGFNANHFLLDAVSFWLRGLSKFAEANYLIIMVCHS